MTTRRLSAIFFAATLALSSIAPAQTSDQTPAPEATPKRLVLIDQDGSGPGGSNQMAMIVLLQAPQVQVLGITMVTGNAWRDEETQHTLRMLELLHRTDVPVAMGAVFPLVRSQVETRLATPLNGKVGWLGAWGAGPTTLVATDHGVMNVKDDSGAISTTLHGPYDVPPMPEGAPTTRPIAEDAAHFLIRQVRAHPHQVTLYAAGPLTNIALAISIDPDFAALTQGIVIMGGSLNPQTDDPEFADSPRHEFNFWFDPEAVHITLRAPFPRIDITTVDISIKAMFTQPMLDQITQAAQADPAHHLAAQNIARWSQDRYYLWDELTAAAFLDPSLITKEKVLYMDVDLSHGPTYGETLTWPESMRPTTPIGKVHAQVDLDLPRFQKLFVGLISAPN